VKENLRKN